VFIARPRQSLAALAKLTFNLWAGASTRCSEADAGE
jgi:hypothetical protein